MDILLLIGIIFLVDFLLEIRKNTPIWEYNSSPSFPLNWDVWVRVITNPLVKLAAGGIISHFWDWRKVKGLTLSGNNWVWSKKDNFYRKFKGKRLNIVDHAQAHLLSGISEVYILRVDAKLLKDNNIKYFHYAYRVWEQDVVYINRILIPIEEPIKILVSATRADPLALNEENKELPLILEGPFKRTDKKVYGLRQF
jgi:hypothetical protein